MISRDTCVSSGVYLTGFELEAHLASLDVSQLGSLVQLESDSGAGPLVDGMVHGTARRGDIRTEGVAESAPDLLTIACIVVGQRPHLSTPHLISPLYIRRRMVNSSMDLHAHAALIQFLVLGDLVLPFAQSQQTGMGRIWSQI